MLWLLVILFITRVSAEHPQLLTYLELGLEQNKSIKQSRERTIQKEYEQKQVRSYFLPKVSFSSRYTIASGGREIPLPIGDLLNPVYENLNQQNIATGGEALFPSIENDTIAFLRSPDLEAKVRVIQPIFIPKVYHGYKAAKSSVRAQNFQDSAIKRDFIRDMQLAYINCILANEKIKVQQSLVEQAREQLRVSTRLVKAGTVTPDVSAGAKAQLLESEQILVQAQTDSISAIVYFNMLLGNSVDAPVVIVPADSVIIYCRDTAEITVSDATKDALENREEILGLETAVHVLKSEYRARRSTYLPELSFVGDAGIQGSSLSFDEDHRFATASLILQWDLFDSFGRESEIGEVASRKREMEIRLAEVKEQVEGQVTIAARSLKGAWSALRPAQQMVDAARRHYSFVLKRYKIGMAPFHELVAAQTSLASAEVNRSVKKCMVLKHDALFDRAVAGGTIPSRHREEEE